MRCVCASARFTWVYPQFTYSEVCGVCGKWNGVVAVPLSSRQVNPPNITNVGQMVHSADVANQNRDRGGREAQRIKVSFWAYIIVLIYIDTPEAHSASSPLLCRYPTLSFTSQAATFVIFQAFSRSLLHFGEARIRGRVTSHDTGPDKSDRTYSSLRRPPLDLAAFLPHPPCQPRAAIRIRPLRLRQLAPAQVRPRHSLIQPHHSPSAFLSRS